MNINIGDGRIIRSLAGTLSVRNYIFWGNLIKEWNFRGIALVVFCLMSLSKFFVVVFILSDFHRILNAVKIASLRWWYLRFSCVFGTRVSHMVRNFKRNHNRAENFWFWMDIWIIVEQVSHSVSIQVDLEIDTVACFVHCLVS